jgi:hypothetical protein
MKKAALLIFPVIFMFSTCALEIANVIGPGGGYVYYDKGNYKDGWRYKECSPFDIWEFTDLNDVSLKKAIQLCKEQSDEWYAFEWELPSESDLKKILECFSYGLTRFKPDYYYLSVNKPETYDVSDTSTWGVVILHKNFEGAANGKVEKVPFKKDDNGNPIKDDKGNFILADGNNEPISIVIRVRPIRKF